MLHELRKVIPSFLKRVDLDDRGVAWSNYLAANRAAMDEVAARLFPAGTAVDPAPTVRLIDFDPDAEVKLVAAMLYAHLSPARGSDRAAGPGHVGRRPPGRDAGLRR